MKMISTMPRLILSTAITLASLASNSAGQELDGMWAKFVVSARVAEYQAIDGGETVVFEKSEIRSVKTTMYGQFVGFGEPEGEAGYAVTMYTDLGSGLEAVGEAQLATVGNVYIMILALPIIEKQGEGLVVVGEASAYTNGLVSTKMKGDEVKSASLKQLGGMTIESEVALSEAASREGTGSCRMKCRTITASKVPPLAK